MPITVQFTFDDTWAARIQDMVENVDHLHHDEILQALLEGAATTWESLTTKQKWKVLVLRDTMASLINYEGRIASKAAQQVVIDDIEDNFPLEIGPA